MDPILLMLIATKGIRLLLDSIDLASAGNLEEAEEKLAEAQLIYKRGSDAWKD